MDKFLDKIKKLTFYKQTWFILVVILSFSLFVRLWYLGQIKELIFDEFYYVDFAKKYLNHIEFYDVHPPLGKLLIAIPIAFFGDSQFYWRIMESLFGTAFIYVMYLAGKELAGKTVGIIAAAIIAFDGMFLVYSRVGVLEIFLCFFILLTFYLTLKFLHTKKLVFLVLSGICLGLAASVKYIGFFFYGAYFWLFLIHNYSLRKNWWKILLFLVVIPILIYCATFLVNFPLKNIFADTWYWQKQSVFSNLQALSMAHPYASKWWTWFWLKRPICFFFKELADGRYMAIYALGNPFIWWTALLALPVWIWLIFKNNIKTFILLVPFLVFIVPWIFVKRILYIYHAMPAFMFLVLGLAIILEKVYNSRFGKIMLLIYFLIAILFFIYFLPIWIAIPISPVQFQQHMWFKSWI